MEYIISNIRFPESKDSNGLFYRGKFDIHNNKINLFEGYLIEDNFLDKVHPENNKGVFNYVEIDCSKKVITIINDKLGQLSLYYYLFNGEFVLSNSFWSILKIIGKSRISILETRLKEMLFFHRIPIEGETFIEHVKFVKASSVLKIDYDKSVVREEKYWKIKQITDNNISLEEASQKLEKSFDNFFNFLKTKFQNQTFVFGNSGGLDSRLIPMFARKHDLNLIGVTIGNRKPYKIFKSVSHRSAEKISKLFGFQNYSIESTKGDYNKRLLLDIRNNPFSGNQVFKNTYDQLPDFQNLICGGNGFIVSNDSGIWEQFDNIDPEKRFEFLFDYLNKEKLSIPYKNSYRVKKYLNIPLNIDYTQSLYRKWFTKKDINKFKNDFIYFYNENKDLDNFSLIRHLHLSILNKQSPNGGLESINRTKSFFYLYYPFALEESVKWDKDFFYGRKILTSIIKRNNEKLAHIPDQKMNKIIGQSTRMNKLINIAIRRSGMDYVLWANQTKFKKVAKDILERENPIFNNILNGNKINFAELIKTHPHFWLDVIKIKKITDVLHYEEMDFIDNKEFQIQ